MKLPHARGNEMTRPFDDRLKRYKLSKSQGGGEKMFSSKVKTKRNHMGTVDQIRENCPVDQMNGTVSFE
jgi:hypothetical protein